MLNYEYPPLGGGAGNATAHLLEALAKRTGIHVDLVTASAGSEQTAQPCANVVIRYLDIGKKGDIHYQSMHDLLSYTFRARACLRRLLEESAYSLCHAFFGIPCGYLAQGTGLPYIVSLRGSDVPFYNPRFNLLDRLCFKRLSARIWRGAAAVVANSSGLRELAHASIPEQAIEVIPNGVDTERFHPGQCGQDPLRILCVSRLIPRKGIDLLVRAAAALPAGRARLTLAGAGPEEASLRALAEEVGVAAAVDFLGAVPHEEVPDLYRKHHVFVLPSYNEGMSNSALEAMASGLPVILTDTGGSKELLREGQNGFLVEKGSSNDIANAIGFYLDHPGELRVHGQRSREQAMALSWEQTAKAYLDLYGRIAEETDP